MRVGQWRVEGVGVGDGGVAENTGEDVLQGSNQKYKRTTAPISSQLNQTQ